MYSYLILRTIAAALALMISYKKGRNVLLWPLLCFMLPPLLVLVIILPPKVARGITKRCPHCKGIIPEGASSCRHCGRELPIEMVQCRSCGSYVRDRDFCEHCNRKLRG